MHVDVAVVDERLESRFAFRCLECGHSALALVRASGEGSAVVNATHADPDEAAAARARWVAEQNLRRARWLVRCPRCGRFDRQALGRYRRGRVLVAGVLGGLAGIAAVGGTWASDVGLSRMGWIVGFGLAFCTVQPLLQALWPRAADVTFDPP